MIISIALHHHRLFGVWMQGTIRTLLHQHSVLIQALLVPFQFVCLCRSIHYIDDLLHNKRPRPKRERNTPILRTQPIICHMERDGTKLDNQDLEYRRNEENDAEIGIVQKTLEYID